MRRKTNILLLCMAMSALFVNVNQSHAYLDPGTGSMLVQGVLAAIAAVGVSVGVFWKRIKAFFGGPSQQNAENGNKQDRD